MSVDLESVGQVSLLPLLLSLFLIPQSGGSADVPYLYSALSWVTLIPFPICIWSLGQYSLKKLPPTHANLAGQEAIP